MVQRASSSKSKSVHTAFKVGPPKKKPDAVSMAKAKKTKERSKKYGRGGIFFFPVERLCS
jgi:hypothetical protein